MMNKIDISNRRYNLTITNNYDIYITGNIHDDLGHNLFIAFNKVKEDMKDNINKTINIYLSTYGGDLYTGLAIYDNLNRLKNEGYTINIYVMGYAYSCGTIIMCGASNVYITQNSNIMIHHYSAFLGWSNHTKIEDAKIAGDILVKKMLRIYNRRCNIKITKKHLEKDWYIEPNEALKIGFVDEIL